MKKVWGSRRVGGGTFESISFEGGGKPARGGILEGEKKEQRVETKIERKRGILKDHCLA